MANARTWNRKSMKIVVFDQEINILLDFSDMKSGKDSGNRTLNCQMRSDEVQVSEKYEIPILLVIMLLNQTVCKSRMELPGEQYIRKLSYGFLEIFQIQARSQMTFFPVQNYHNYMFLRDYPYRS